MPIVVHLDRLLRDREMTLTELANRIGLTVANLSILKTGKAKAVRFSTLEAICAELHCQPGELLEHVDGTGGGGPDEPGQTRARAASGGGQAAPGRRGG